jgi:hypothetical protein
MPMTHVRNGQGDVRNGQGRRVTLGTAKVTLGTARVTLGTARAGCTEGCQGEIGISKNWKYFSKVSNFDV